jgi:hypothetical protein
LSTTTQTLDGSSIEYNVLSNLGVGVGVGVRVGADPCVDPVWADAAGRPPTVAQPASPATAITAGRASSSRLDSAMCSTVRTGI